MSVSTNLSRRGFMALASGLLVPAPERVRSYSFGPIYENFVQLRDGLRVEARLCYYYTHVDFAVARLRDALTAVKSSEVLYRCRALAPGEEIERVVIHGYEASLDERGIVSETTYHPASGKPRPLLEIGGTKPEGLWVRHLKV